MELHELQDRLDGRAALEAELEALYRQMQELQTQIKLDQTNLEYEQSDVEELQGNTLKSVFYTVIGKKEERLEKEESEAEAAKDRYENTSLRLEEVKKQIKRVQGELQRLKSDQGTYTRLLRELPDRIREIEPRLCSEDAVTLEVTQKEISLQKKRQEYYTELTEECQKLSFYIQLVQDSLQDMIDEDCYGSVFGEYAAKKEALEKRELVDLQTKRLADCLQKGIKLENDYCLDIGSIDNMIIRVFSRCNDYHDSPGAYERLSRVPDLALNLQGLMYELERKLERSRRFKADLNRRLFDLVQKYQSN